MKVRVFEKRNKSWQREDLSNNNDNNHNHDHSVSNDNIFFICFVYFQRETKMHLKPRQLMLHYKFLSKQMILLDCKIIF